MEIRATGTVSILTTAFLEANLAAIDARNADFLGRAHARAAFTTTVGTGPGSFSFGGAISFVLEREGGSWKLAGGHTSSPAPVGR